MNPIKRALGALSTVLGLKSSLADAYRADYLARRATEADAARAAGQRPYGHLYPSHPVRKP